MRKPAFFTAVFGFVTAFPGMAQTGPCAAIVPGNLLPDLIVDANRLRSDVVITRETFSPNSCSVAEGCISSKGTHQLLRFSASTPNIGGGDLVIGDPARCPNLFDAHVSECHNHFHFKEYSDYRLWTQAGYSKWSSTSDPGAPTNTGWNATLLAQAVQNKELLLGRKQGFCMIDVERYEPSAPALKRYTLCGSLGSPGNQGLQAGWTDVYAQSLDCQFIEIDNLVPGVYVLEVQVNPEHLLPEANYANNSAAVSFQVVYRRGNQPPVVVFPSSSN